MFELMCVLLLSSAFKVEAVRDSAILQMKQGRWTDACQSMNIVLTSNPADVFSLGLLKFTQSEGMVPCLNRKFTAILARSTDKMIDFWEKFCDADSLNVNILYVLATLYLDKNLAAAQSTAGRIMEIDSLNAQAFVLKGHIERKMGNYDAAIHDYSKSHGLDSTLSNAHVMLGNIYLIQNKPDSASKYFSTISDEHARYFELHTYEILCRLKLGEYSLAQTLVSEADMNIGSIETVSELHKIDEYLSKRSNGSLTNQDTFVIFTALTSEYLFIPDKKSEDGEPLPDMWPIAVLTTSGVDFIYCTNQVARMELLHLPIPRYPEDLKIRGLEGSVEILALVDTNGSIMHAEVLSSSGYDDFDEAALYVVRLAQLKPVQVSGVPIRSWVLFPINFKLY